MNIYKMNDCDWVAAKTKKQAIEFYRTECSFEDSEIPNVRQLTKNELDKTDFMEEYEKRECSFGEKLQKLIKDGSTFPLFFATTEF